MYGYGENVAQIALEIDWLSCRISHFHSNMSNISFFNGYIINMLKVVFAA